MKRAFLLAAILGTVLCGAGHAAEPVAACQPPDPQLIKSRGQYTHRQELPEAEKIARYNAQAKAFNDCTKRLVDGNNDEIDKVRDAANADIARVREAANQRILDINAKINLAVSETISTAADAPGAYPGPTCRKPDERAAQYARLRGEYETCVKTYIEQASTASRETSTTAQSEIHAITSLANERIAQLQGTVKSGIQTANAAAVNRSHTVEGTMLGRDDPILVARAAENPLENSKASDAWPVQDETPSGEGNARAITCRSPKPLSDSRLMGPKVCFRNGVWAQIRKAGKDVAPDGVTFVDLDLKRRTKPLICATLPVETQRSSSLCN